MVIIKYLDESSNLHKLPSPTKSFIDIRNVNFVFHKLVLVKYIEIVYMAHIWIVIC